MKPIRFKEVNRVYGEGQPQYQPLPACTFNGVEGEVVTCWRLTWKERFKVLFNGNIWASQLTFNNDYQPIFITSKKEDVIVYLDENGKIIKEKKLWWEYVYPYVLQAQENMEECTYNLKLLLKSKFNKK